MSKRRSRKRCAPADAAAAPPRPYKQRKLAQNDYRQRWNRPQASVQDSVQAHTSSTSSRIIKPLKTTKHKEPKKPRTGFFDLPQEIRDRIFEDVWKVTPSLTVKWNPSNPLSSRPISETAQSNDTSILLEAPKMVPLKMTIRYDLGCACTQGLPSWLRTSRRFLKEGLEQLYRKGSWVWEPRYQAEFTANMIEEKEARKAAKAAQSSVALVAVGQQKNTRTSETPAVRDASIEVPGPSNEHISSKMHTTSKPSRSYKHKVTKVVKNEVTIKEDIKRKRSNGDDIDITDFCFLAPSAAAKITLKLGSLNYKRNHKRKSATIGIQERKKKDLSFITSAAAQSENLKSLRVMFDHGQTRKLKRDHAWDVDLGEISKFKSPSLETVELEVNNGFRVHHERHIPGDPRRSQELRKMWLRPDELKAALEEAVSTPLEDELKRELCARGRSLLGGEWNDEKGGVWCGNRKIEEEEWWQGSCWKFKFSKAEPMDITK